MSANIIVIISSLLCESVCSRRVSTKFKVIFCGSCLNEGRSTENEWRFYYFCSFFVSFSLQRPQATPVVSGGDLGTAEARLINVLLSFVEDGDPEII